MLVFEISIRGDSMALRRMSPHVSGNLKSNMADIKPEVHVGILFSSSRKLIYITCGCRLQLTRNNWSAFRCRRFADAALHRRGDSPTRRFASPHGVSPTRRFVAGVSPTRRFAAERYADAAIRRHGASPHAVSPTRRFVAGVSPTRRFTDAAIRRRGDRRGLQKEKKIHCHCRS